MLYMAIHLFKLALGALIAMNSLYTVLLAFENRLRFWVPRGLPFGK